MRILIIEDDLKLAKIMKEAFAKEGYAVDCLNEGGTGQQRIELYHKNYDLIILDWMLPEKTGYEICSAAREKQIETPILMLTAKSEVDDKISALDAGADDYLVKPFSFRELLARVRAIARRPKQAMSKELKVKDLILNPVTRKVERGGRKIELTLKEFRLLEYFMRHPNETVTREQIQDNIWAFDFDSFSNVVDVHIKNLRKKIEKNDEKLIWTARGVGYILKS